MHSTSFSFLPHLFLFLLVKGSISIYYKSCKFSRLLRCTPAKYERPKHAFISVLSICLAPLSYENQLEIELMYLFVYNKMRSKILFTIHKLQVSSSVLAFFSFGQTNRSWHKIFCSCLLMCLLIGFSLHFLYPFQKNILHSHLIHPHILHWKYLARYLNHLNNFHIIFILWRKRGPHINLTSSGVSCKTALQTQT